ncbi:SMP-30/gluconolactonase/LRE family protein [Pacificoceanicola onchidii]|uniref:SMP-30/gluconolactonase/LRE family protein n=1 Tax=Pacificoceanicola onchidii TaxID=2562685 RepID=UPI0010A354D1|nr:SMP-30/gluconolactonase/LRE family protein [Pacificoceanicola onchidii]
MAADVISKTRCALGEGPLWHPERAALFWFDIKAHRLYEWDGRAERHWQFDRAVSAAGWVDHDTLLVATARDLVRFDLKDGTQTHVADLEPDNAATRSNDGRADPQGGFWIGTMGYEAEPGLGAIYRYYRGEVRKLFPDITISNAICFAPSGDLAYFADSAEAKVWRVALDAEGWPNAAPEVFLDLGKGGITPDGAVVDAQGNFWNAQWGAGRVACYGPDGGFEHAFRLPASQTTCPAFGGPTLTRLIVTSAAGGAPDGEAQAGQTFAIDTLVTGQREHQVIL